MYDDKNNSVRISCSMLWEEAGEMIKGEIHPDVILVLINGFKMRQTNKLKSKQYPIKKKEIHEL